MVRADLAGDLDAAFLGRLDEQDFLFQRDMGNVDRPVVDGGHQDGGCHAAALGMGHDGRFLWPVLEMLLPEGHVIQAQLAEGAVEIHLQPGRLWGQTCMPVPIGIIRSRAEELGIIAAGLGARRFQGQVEGPGIEDGRLGVGHGQQHGHAARQRRGWCRCPSLPCGSAPGSRRWTCGSINPGSFSIHPSWMETSKKVTDFELCAWPSMRTLNFNEIHRQL